MKIEGTTMADNKGGDRSALKPVSETATLNLNTPDAEGPPAGWKGFGRRRGSLDFLFHNHHTPQPDEAKPPASERRKTSLTPEMEIPSNLMVRRNSADSESPGTSPTSRGSILEGFMKTGLVSMNSTIQEEEDIVPPLNQPRRTSMTDAMQWLFKPMDTPKQLKPRDFNAFVPTST